MSTARPPDRQVEIGNPDCYPQVQVKASVRSSDRTVPLHFDRRVQAALYAQIAGACRLVWNLLLADCERRYRLNRDFGNWSAVEGAVPIDTSGSFFTLGKRFVDLRSRPDATWIRTFLGSPWERRYRETDLSWLRDMPCAPLRYTAKYLADTVPTVIVEDLNTKDMTRSAKATVEEPGKNVRRKAGFNREILASNLGAPGTVPGLQGRTGHTC